MQKEYLSYNLNPNKLVPYWFLFLALLLLPYLSFFLRYFRIEDPTSILGIVQQHIGWVGFLTFIGYCFFYFQIIKLSIQGLSFREESLKTKMRFGSFLGVVILGIVFSVMSIGIYVPWFIQLLMSYFTNGTSYKGQNFDFKGTGGALFIIFLKWVILPSLGIGLIAFLMADLFETNLANGGSAIIVLQVFIQIITYFLFIPFFYFSYKWRADVVYGFYDFEVKSEFWPSVKFIAIQLLLTLITLGFYFPMAFSKMAERFINETLADSATGIYTFEYEANHQKDYVFYLVQMLLIVVTIGFYYPWAMSKIGGYVVGKTAMVYKPVVYGEVEQIDGII